MMVLYKQQNTSRQAGITMVRAKSETAKVTTKAKGGRACATRALLLDAAVKVIGEKGYSGATVDEIVEVAGVSKGTAFYHFKSKADIAASVLEDGIGQIIEQAPDGPHALMGMVEIFATRIFENKQFGRFFVSELWRAGRVWSDDMRETEENLLGLISSQLKRAQDDGYMREEIDVEFEAVSLVGMVLTTSLYYIDGKPEVRKEEFIRNIADFVSHANAKNSHSIDTCWE
ncbi:MAG: TetR/AcrR family transcriptional regulator [Raoultibacter sp.]